MKSFSNNKLYIFRVALLLAIITTYFSCPGIHAFFLTGTQYLHHRDFEGLRQFILSFGAWAPLTSIALMTIQSLFPIVPGILITIANAWIFGWQYGALYSWIGALIGATIDFILARWFGRPLAECFISEKYLDKTDWFFRKYGIWAVFITRMTPIIPFKLVSYGAGLSELNLIKFIVATGSGQIIPIIIYSIVGQNLIHNKHGVIAITTLIALVSLILVGYRKKISSYLNYFLKNDKVE